MVMEVLQGIIGCILPDVPLTPQVYPLKWFIADSIHF